MGQTISQGMNEAGEDFGNLFNKSTEIAGTGNTAGELRDLGYTNAQLKEIDPNFGGVGSVSLKDAAKVGSKIIGGIMGQRQDQPRMGAPVNFTPYQPAPIQTNFDPNYLVNYARRRF